MSAFNRLRRCFLGFALDGQDGFFEASLCSAFPDSQFAYLHDVVYKHADYFKTFDWVLINRKAVPAQSFESSILRGLLHKLRPCKIALVVNNAEETELPPEEWLAPFDLVFKREFLIDKSIYGMRAETLRKVKSTMISCPFVHVRKSPFGLKISYDHYSPLSASAPCFDVSFLGADTNRNRREVLAAVSGCEFSFSGGLYPHADKRSPLKWEGPGCAQVNVREYAKMIQSSRVNLALAGYGGFTYRHLELWFLGAFMLSDSSICKIDLAWAEVPQDGVHYVGFSGLDDLMDKIRYYIKNESARLRIANDGQRLFSSIYDIEKHGRFISNALAAHDGAGI